MDNNRQGRGFVDWVNRAPTGVAPDFRRLYGLARVGFPMGVFVHFFFIFLFWHLDQPVMALFNLFSVAVFGWATWFAWTLCDIKLPTILSLLFEVPLHAVLATYYMGFAPFFLAYLLLVVMVASLLPFFTRRTRLGLCFA